MAKKALKPKEPIRLREKELSNGNVSLYLDIYRNGKRQYEFLKLYLIPETASNPKAKEQNKETIIQANAIKAKRILEITNDEAGLKNSYKSKMLLVDWLNLFLCNQIENGKRWVKQVEKSIELITEYCGGNARLIDIDKDFCKGYVDFLTNKYKTSTGKKLSQWTIRNYTTAIICALNSAVRDEIISKNPFDLLAPSERTKLPESQRIYLTLDEVERLKQTDCKNEAVKQAFLFGCFCGLRISDIRRLTWANVEIENGVTRLAIVQKKTKNPLYLTLSNTALNYLPERKNKEANEPIFDIICLSAVERYLKQWGEDAEISKHITFHTARHTFATSLLTLGADLFTTSKLLGHAEVRTTQIYAKIIDKKKDEAMSLFDKAFANDNK